MYVNTVTDNLSDERDSPCNCNASQVSEELLDIKYLLLAVSQHAAMRAC